MSGVVCVGSRHDSRDVDAPGLSSTGERASALDALPDPLFIMKPVRDVHGTIVELTYAFLNEAAARLCGMSVDEVLGHGAVRAVPVRQGAGDLGLLPGGHRVRFTGVLRCALFQENGVEGSFRLSATRFGDGLLICANDTTRAKRAEEAVEQDRVRLRAIMDSGRGRPVTR